MTRRFRVVLILIVVIGAAFLLIGWFSRAGPSAFRDEPGALVGVVAALAAALIAARYRRVLRDRDAAYEAERSARQESERARGRLARLQNVTVALSGAVSTGDAVEAVTRHVVEAVGASGASLGLIDESGRTLDVIVTVARQAEPASTHRLSVDADIALCAAYRTGEAIDVSAKEWKERFPAGYEFLGHLGHRLISRPLIVGAERVGAIGLTFSEERRFDAGDLELLDAVVGQVALAVPRVRSFESEQRIAATLQDSLFPRKLPRIPGVELAARYVVGAEDMDVGGDWYDAVALPDGSVCVAVGDVRGRGLRAAAAMGQLRIAWHTLVTLEGMSPATVLNALDRQVEEIPDAVSSTVVTARLDPGTGRFEFACAGHPPPLVIGHGGEAAYLEGGRSMPLGVPWHDEREEQRVDLAPGSTLLLFTDGLIERRGEPIDRGLQRLRDTATSRGDVDSLDELGGHLSRMIPSPHDDDVAMLFLRPVSSPTRFVRTFTSDPRELARLRREVRGWLRLHDAAAGWVDDVVLACGEAASNAIEHGYGDTTGDVEVSIEIAADGSLIASVTDRGSWRPEGPDPFRGRGLDIIRSLMDGIDIRTGSDGTTVSMRKTSEEQAAIA